MECALVCVVVGGGCEGRMGSRQIYTHILSAIHRISTKDATTAHASHCHMHMHGGDSGIHWGGKGGQRPRPQTRTREKKRRRKKEATPPHTKSSQCSSWVRNASRPFLPPPPPLSPLEVKTCVFACEREKGGGGACKCHALSVTQNPESASLTQNTYVDQPTGRPADRSTNQPINQPIGALAQPTPTNQPPNYPTSQQSRPQKRIPTSTTNTATRRMTAKNVEETTVSATRCAS
jgi:hypothetical protein